MTKFSLLHEILLEEGLLEESDVIEPDEASWQDLKLVHTIEYLDKLCNGLSRKDERRLGLPWSPALVRRSRLAVQGTLQAARMALEDGIAANLAGGTHHAFSGHGEGFCVLNDIAIATRRLLADEIIKRILIIDLDVHQGNGTAAILGRDNGVFTFSIHGAKNFPFVKESSTLDIELDDHVDDEVYMDTLRNNLWKVFDAAEADLVFYLAGVDVVEGDRYGRLALTRTGLRNRENFVIESVVKNGIPLVLLMSGGYASSPFVTADLHAEVHRIAYSFTLFRHGRDAKSDRINGC